MEGFGIPNYGSDSSSGGSYIKFFRLKEGSNVYRLLPPVGKLAAKGQWRVYLSNHYGYVTPSKRDPHKTNLRTFRCIEDRDWNTKVVRVACPECELIKEREATLKAVTASLESKGMNREQISRDEKVVQLSGWLRAHNVDRKWHINAINPSGEVGVLLISNKLKKQLDERMAEVKARGLDPLLPDQGVWFNFRRTGKGIETTDVCEVVREEMGDGSERIKRAPIDKMQVGSIIAQLPEDLSEVLTRLTTNQIEMLTKYGSDPEEAEKIFNGVQIRATASTPAPTPMAAAPAPVVSANNSELEALRRRMAELEASAPAPVAAPVAPVAPAAAPSVVDEDDFLSKYNFKNA